MFLLFILNLFIFYYFQNNGEKTPSKGSSTATTPSSDRKTSDGSSPEPPLDLPQVCLSLLLYNYNEPHQWRPSELMIRYYLSYKSSMGSWG